MVSPMKEFLQSCASPLSEELETAIEEAGLIDRKFFARQCNLSPTTALDMLRYPDDYDFFQCGDILFYSHSCIEYFYR